MVIRVESRGVTNSAGTTTHFRILVDGTEVSQAHVVHRSNDVNQAVTFFGAKTVSADEHTVKLQCKVSDSTTSFENGYKFDIHGMRVLIN